MVLPLAATKGPGCLSRTASFFFSSRPPGLGTIFAAFLLFVLAAGFSSILVGHHNLRMPTFLNIRMEDAPKRPLTQHLLDSSVKERPTTTLKLDSCPATSPHLIGIVNVTFQNRTLAEVLRINNKLLPGGRYRPLDCIAHHKTAIIIPYRQREEHLRELLNHLHPMLQRQQLDYGIFVVEPFGLGKFNRGLLMNVGYAEARKAGGYTCFVFHDVDLFPENDCNIYGCLSDALHLSVYIDKFNYKLLYPAHFGGVSALSNEQMIKINGWPNAFWGWGGEDDDLSWRVQSHGYKILRPPPEHARYKMIKHGSDHSNPVNPHRFSLLGSAGGRYDTDGLSNLNYTLVESKLEGLYTWLHVDIGTVGDDFVSRQLLATKSAITSRP